MHFHYTNQKQGQLKKLQAQRCEIADLPKVKRRQDETYAGHR